MPRTRSLKWSELKIGIMAVVALIIAATLILTLSGVAGMWWQRYHLKIRVANAGGVNQVRKRGQRSKLARREQLVEGIQAVDRRVDGVLRVGECEAREDYFSDVRNAVAVRILQVENVGRIRYEDAFFPPHHACWHDQLVSELPIFTRVFRPVSASRYRLPLSSGQYEGMGRYCAVLFPFFILAAGIRWRAGFIAMLAISALLYTICLALFTTIHPIF